MMLVCQILLIIWFPSVLGISMDANQVTRTICSHGKPVNSSYQCCINYYYHNAECKACPIGEYRHINQETCNPCNVNSYGKDCSNTCHCNPSQRCDPVSGCANVNGDELSVSVYVIFIPILVIGIAIFAVLFFRKQIFSTNMLVRPFRKGRPSQPETSGQSTDDFEGAYYTIRDSRIVQDLEENKTMYDLGDGLQYNHLHESVAHKVSKPTPYYDHQNVYFKLDIVTSKKRTDQNVPEYSTTDECTNKQA